MLISFSIQNWKSFKSKQTISAIASKQRNFSERVPRSKKYKLKILPILAIYGGNASGKTNLFRAISFACNFIVKGTKTRDQEIGVQPFLLHPELKNEPTKFWFTILANENMYEYYFAATRKRIHEERLTQILPTKEKLLFSRNGKKWELGNLKEESHINYVRESTRDNQLFLTSTIDLNNQWYSDIYSWFAYNTTLISPEAQYAEPDYIVNKKHEKYKKANALIRELDTGISRFSYEDIEGIDFPKLNLEASEDIEGVLFSLVGHYMGERMMRIKKKGKDALRTIVSYHDCEDGTKIKFDLAQESAGTRRLIDILPAFLKDKNLEYRTYIIDEFDRSLHHLLLRSLIEKFLAYCSDKSRIQLIFTTHDLLLMDQKLFRRDEMYVIERDRQGGSEIIPLNEYKGLRSDKNILKSYLQGRFGGIPRI